MTTFLLTLYFTGLGLMLFGLLMSPRSERKDALLLPTLLAYLLWPISLAVIVGLIVRERIVGEAMASEHALA